MYHHLSKSESYAMLRQSNGGQLQHERIQINRRGRCNAMKDQEQKK
jgi:hypothetical protein